MNSAAEWLEDADNQLFVWINSGLGHRNLDDFFLALSGLGAWPILLVALALLSHAGRRTLRIHAAVMLGVLALCMPLLKVAKHRFHRERPVAEFRELEHRNFVSPRVVGSERMEKFSFPSGHTLLAFYAMTYVALARRSCRGWALLLAAGVGLSRVYVGAHFPFDCVGGALFGATGGWVAWRIFLRVQRCAGAGPRPAAGVA